MEQTVQDEDAEPILEVQSRSPANDRLALVMDWVGLSAAIGMIVAAVIIAT
ncbi:hypothetical protein [Microvirga sp. KLBC 81]|uniref:hypothetical protein n=1 Tax=Microvirga sp. KLBC 81 TaxID=1862707 RepID=UPI001403FC11|nr:hypothetical protein [Microvirga sp. KLBC 81]